MRFVVAFALIPAIVAGAGRLGAAPDTPPPSMPQVVAHGRSPTVRGCASCHLPSGLGRPESSSLAGLPAAYIAQQIADYRRGVRRSSAPEVGPPSAMVAIAKAIDEADVRAAAEYFASITPKKWIDVVEADVVPRTRVSGGAFVALDEGGTEPIGRRIVEVPRDRRRAGLPDSTSGFVAYVPVGSIERGEHLVATGGAGKTVRCANCHGADLKGLGPVPGIAGRSPSYQVRQLHDIQRRTRHGLGADLMMATVARLTDDDFVSIAAFTASLVP